MSTISRSAKFAERTSRLRASTIREMLKVTQQPNVISFGGGLPAPELFPVAAVAECTAEIMDEIGANALQYSVTQGIPEMRTWVAQRLATQMAHDVSADDVLIVNGSQQGLDLLGKIFLDPGDHVLLERPTYLGAIQAFDAYQAQYLSVETDEHGIVPESLERIIERADPLPKFLYLVPTFQNPTGRTLSIERRERIVRICERFEVPIVEDDPYHELRFEGEPLPPLVSFARNGSVIYLGTGSKIVAPGLRIAWLVASDPEVREKLILAKQGADLHSGSLAQYIFHRFVSRREAFARHLEAIVATYRGRRDVMYAALGEFMPESVRFNKPEGGMFLWASVAGIDTTALLERSKEERVVFVPGVSFYPQRDVVESMRLNFSNAGEEKIRVGIERLASVIRSFAR
ncbi:MAG: aminotransferase-like domain-containing protein [Vulcanimicrobiaceae bacterium]